MGRQGKRGRGRKRNTKPLEPSAMDTNGKHVGQLHLPVRESDDNGVRAVIPNNSAKIGVRCQAQVKMEETMSNPLLLRQILKELDVPTLLKVSLVNKNWCYHARFVLQSSKKCIAGNVGKNPCRELLELNKTLSSCVHSPFSGLALRTGEYVEDVPYLNQDHTKFYYAHNLVDEYDDQPNVDDFEDYLNDGVCESSDEDEAVSKLWNNGHIAIQDDITQTYAALLEKITFRYIEIHWEEGTTCPADTFLKEMLQNKMSQVKELKFTQVPLLFKSFETYRAKTMTSSNWLPSLKVLDLSSVTDMERKVKFELLRAAPNLQQLCGYNSIEDLHFFLENECRLSVLKHFVFFCEHDDRQTEEDKQSQVQALLKLSSSNLQITTFDIHDYCVGNVPTEECHKSILRPLMLSLAPRLEELKLNEVHLMLILRECLTLPLEMLKRINVTLEPFYKSLDGPPLERFEWSRCFPALRTVELSVSPKTRDFIIYTDQLREIPVSAPCITVSEIILVQHFDEWISWDIKDMFNYDMLRYIFTLFPNVKEFTNIGGGEKIEQVLKFLWVSWPNLEFINLTWIKPCYVAKSLDAVFCGVTKSRASNSLGRKSVEALQSMDFVPTFPSLLSLQKLKKFRIEFTNHRGCSSREGVIPSRVLMTNVTGELVLARMPQLSVEIVRAPCKAPNDTCAFKFEHLKPFVKLIEPEVTSVVH